MIERTGNIFSQRENKVAVILITTNEMLRYDNTLVMGAGMAKEALKYDPSLPKIFGEYIHKWNYNYASPQDYFLILPPRSGGNFGAIQTKRDWRDPSPMNLIQNSITMLKQVAQLSSHLEYHTTRLGCGLGGLDWEGQVEPLCRKLPDNVVVWSKE